MKISIILILPFFLSGCLYFNDRGISNEYYNDCREYYDSMGIYHKECDKNLVDYKEIKQKYRDIKEDISSLAE